MSDDFTYEKPNENDYFDTLLDYLEFNNELEILNVLNGGKCTIRDSNTFSRIRWNASATGIYFEVPIDHLNLVNNEIQEKLIIFCDKIMPKEVGFDVTYVEFSPLLCGKRSESIVKDLDNTLNGLSEGLVKDFLQIDLIEKGKEMSEVYMYLYVVENYLRVFIDLIGQKKLGQNYFEKFKINNDIRNNIKGRKINEDKNKWLPLRGDSDIFYLDFSDLGNIIQNNWSIFKEYFPNMPWITTKINELADCRHLIAHNSYIDDHGKNVIKTYYNSILKQLDGKM